MPAARAISCNLTPSKPDAAKACSATSRIDSRRAVAFVARVVAGPARTRFRVTAMDRHVPPAPRAPSRKEPLSWARGLPRDTVTRDEGSEDHRDPGRSVPDGVRVLGLLRRPVVLRSDRELPA